jgi:hypothetical protein
MWILKLQSADLLSLKPHQKKFIPHSQNYSTSQDDGVLAYITYLTVGLTNEILTKDLFYPTERQLFLVLTV